MDKTTQGRTADNGSAERKSPMTKREMTSAILTAKSVKGVTWAEIVKTVGLSEVYTTSACLGAFWPRKAPFCTCLKKGSRSHGCLPSP